MRARRVNGNSKNGMLNEKRIMQKERKMKAAKNTEEPSYDDSSFFRNMI